MPMPKHYEYERRNSTTNLVAHDAVEFYLYGGLSYIYSYVMISTDPFDARTSFNIIGEGLLHCGPHSTASRIKCIVYRWQEENRFSADSLLLFPTATGVDNKKQKQWSTYVFYAFVIGAVSVAYSNFFRVSSPKLWVNVRLQHNRPIAHNLINWINILGLRPSFDQNQAVGG